MPIIEINTRINAEREIVFDLSRSIDLHQLSTSHTHEKAIAGRTSGLIELGETVTWRAKHFGVYQQLSVRITEFDYPNYFVDEMERGAFKRFRHTHDFQFFNGGTLMRDIFDYTSPFGVIGNLADALFLKQYMKNFLIRRNNFIKTVAESDQWRVILKR